MSNRVKIELIATLLRESSHDVEVISQGEVIDTSLTFYPSFAEPQRFHRDVPIYYGSVLPIRRLNGLWSNSRTLGILKERHREKPYDLMIIFNMKGPQIACANYAIRQLGIPVVLEYEDDRFVSVEGKQVEGIGLRRDLRAARRLLHHVSGCVAVSPHLLTQLPHPMPTLLLRGVVGADVIAAAAATSGRKKNRLLFSGTHIASNGVAELIEAWRMLDLPSWELHITGYGGLTESLRQSAAGVRGIVFHGLGSRTDLVEFMTSASICLNPHQVSKVPGNVFAFKIIEYLAAGAHVVTTPMGSLEKDLEQGVTYMPDNSPRTIADTITRVIASRAHERSAADAAQRHYGPHAVSKSLNQLIEEVAVAPTHRQERISA